MSISADLIWDVVFLLLGLLLIAYALVRPPRWDPVNIARGEFTFRVPSAVFLIVLGVLVASVGIFFRYQRYDARLADTLEQVNANKQVIESLNRRVQEMRDDLLRFRSYELFVELTFPETVEASGMSLQGLVRKPGSPAPSVREVQLISAREKLLMIRIENLNAGDKVTFAAVEPRRSRTWMSTADYEVPAVAKLDMRNAR
ncbi:MAG: hypothetical protein ACRD09_08910 [Vicinamibacterales bacterium]